MKINYRPVIITCSIIAALLIGVSVIIALRGDETPPVNPPSPSPVSAEEISPSPDTANELTEVDGIITAIDLDSSSLTLKSHGEDEEFTFTFTGATDIRTRSGRIISARLLNPGDFVRAFYNEENRLMKLYGSDTVWSYKNVGNLQIDPSLKKMTIGTTIYRYDDSLKIMDSGEFIEPDTLSVNDVLNIYGIDNYIYLIKISKGHGYLTFANDSDFIGGSLSYNPGKTIQLTENLRLELAEGNYSITVKNGDYQAKADIKISNRSTTKFDLFDYGAKPVEYGTIHFDIVPEESDLFIDGIKTQFTEPVKLAYGDHEIEVALGGYTSYHGSLTVDRTDISQSISLSKAPEKEEEEDEDFLYEDTPAAPSATPPAQPDNTSVDDSNTDGNTGNGNNTDDSTDSIPDSTTDDGDMPDIEIIDGDSDDDTDMPDIEIINEETDDDDGASVSDSSATENNDGSADNASPASSGNDEVPDDDEASDGTNVSDGNESSDNTGSDVPGTEDGNESPNGSDTADGTGFPDVSDAVTYHGTFTIYCTNGTAVFVDDTYAGEIEGGCLTLPKPSGIIEIRLTKEGYVTKKYTLTMDDDEEEQSFTFPEMTKSS